MSHEEWVGWIDVDLRNHARSVWCKMRRRAEGEGVSFTITHWQVYTLILAAIGQPCPAIGIIMRRSEVRGGGPNSPSLDRVFPELGYTPQNVRAISLRANKLKSNATIAEIHGIHWFMIRHQAELRRGLHL